MVYCYMILIFLKRCEHLNGSAAVVVQGRIWEWRMMMLTKLVINESINRNRAGFFRAVYK